MAILRAVSAVKPFAKRWHRMSFLMPCMETTTGFPSMTSTKNLRRSWFASRCAFLMARFLRHSKTVARTSFLIKVTMLYFCVTPFSERRLEVCNFRMLLKYGDSGLVCVGRIIVAAHTFLECERLVKTAQHVGVVPLAVVVEDEATLPERCRRLNTLELCRAFCACLQLLAAGSRAVPPPLQSRP